MALKILLADDSMTAQNMGKKILVDAGYEVIPVSNGAAAIKKIAELKPDLVVLDIYMPGYSGLEVCERVKNAPETARMPVLLTVGKMEPYRPEDGAKVRADGVIIKPFEASDLIAAVGKLAELVAPWKMSASAMYEKTIVMKAEDFKDLSYQQWKSEAAAETESPEATAATAQMMSGPAMMDELDAQAPPAAMAAAAASVFQDTMPISFNATPPAAPAFEMPEAPAFETAEAPAFETPEAPAFEMSVPAAPVYGIDDTQPIPVLNEEPPAMEALEFSTMQAPMQEISLNTPEAPAFSIEAEPVDQTPAFSAEPEPASDEPAFSPAPEPQTEAPAFDLSISETGSSFELETSFSAEAVPSLLEIAPIDGLEFTSAPQVGEVEVAQESALEVTMPDEPVISVVADPALATSPEDFAEFATRVGEANPEPITVGIVGTVVPELLLEEQPAGAMQPLESESDHPEVLEAEILDDTVLEEEPVATQSMQAAEEPLATEEALVLEEPAADEFAAEAPAVDEFAPEEPAVEAPAAEAPVPELDLLSELGDAPVMDAPVVDEQEAPAVPEQKAWSAEETMVLPAESMALLEQEMQKSFAQVATLPPAEEAPAEEEILAPSVEQQIGKDAPELADASPEPVAIPEPEASLVTRQDDHEFAAAMHAALNEMQQEAVVTTPDAVLAADATSATMRAPYSSDVEIDAILQAQEPCMILATGTAQAAAAGAGAGQALSLDASRIAHVVQKVFERYKEQMVAEIAKELSEE